MESGLELPSQYFSEVRFYLIQNLLQRAHQLSFTLNRPDGYFRSGWVPTPMYDISATLRLGEFLGRFLKLDMLSFEFSLFLSMGLEGNMD